MGRLSLSFTHGREAVAAPVDSLQQSVCARFSKTRVARNEQLIED